MRLFRILIVSFFFICLGGFVAGVAFHDPDTCWLLALGRWILQHRGLPFVDPFSSGVSTYASVGSGLPLMQYQWLSEIVFYATYAASGLIGLIVLSALIVMTAYMTLPWITLRRSGAPSVVASILVAGSLVLASSRFLTRPQLFTFLLLSALLSIVLSRRPPEGAEVKRQAIGVTAIMTFWANMHIFFPLGVALLWLIGACRVGQNLIDKQRRLPIAGSLAVAAAGTAATMINPWGAGIWVYFLRILHSPVNKLVVENNETPLGAGAAFLLFALLGYAAAICFREAKKTGQTSPPLTSLALFAAALFCGLVHSRLIALSPLLITAAVAESLFFSKAGALKADKEAAQDLSPVSLNSGLGAQVINVCMVVVGALIVANLLPPQLPQGSAGFNPPFGAIAYLRQHRPSGRLLNDPQFGSVMTFYCEKPDLFIDTRFSMFDEQRVFDYQRLALLQPGWTDILSRYRFDWAFLPSSHPLARRLAEAGWSAAYKDAQAIILVKPEPKH